MTSAYYSSLSGMLAASYGLQNTSNNIANMQTHGFKRSDAFYSSLGNGHGEEGNGHGVRVQGSSINFKAGNHQESGSGSDLAIVGNGFFVVKLKNNELVYTRDGHFEFKNGVLTDHKTGGQVQGYDHAGNLVPIYEKGPKISAGKASRNVFVHGTLIPHETSDNSSPGPKAPEPNIPKPGDPTPQYENIIFELKNIYDAQGHPHTIKFELQWDSITPTPVNTKHEPLNWNIVDISCDEKNVTIDYSWQAITFDPTTKLLSDKNNSIQFLLDGQPVSVYFGDALGGQDERVALGDIAKEQTATSTIEIHKNDGYPQGTQYKLTIDEEGLISYHYNNDQIIKGIYVGMASFDDMENNLIQTQDNFFRAKTPHGIHYGHANTKGLDAIKSGWLENSNVDPTMEFANIVVLQRMFQACSQIMDIDKQLLEELETKL
ncbi:flagellar hook-basal body complex protein [Legionella lytica]|uniref:Flagellar hook-basal body complex protein n=1 Tax=Legionella lytica TaxID=96232 RepID=A0ABW8D8Z4_9GAMM